MTNLNDLKVKELREIAAERNIIGRWDMNKTQLIEAITEHQKGDELLMTQVEEMINNEKENEGESNMENNVEEIVTITEPETTETESNRRGGRTRTIVVTKDGEEIKRIEGLMQTFKWASENNIANVGWVKESLKHGIPTKAGRKYKEGGYIFTYVDDNTTNPETDIEPNTDTTNNADAE